MNKTQIQNPNIRKPSNTYLNLNRYPTDPSPVRANKENIVKHSFLKPTLQNHLIKNPPDRTVTPSLTPNMGKASVVSIFLKPTEDTEVKLNRCPTHMRRLRFELAHQPVCSRCAIEYAIAHGLPIQTMDAERKMLTFGSDGEHEQIASFASNTQKDLLLIQNFATSRGDAQVKKKELKDFVVRVGEVISQNMQMLRNIQNQECERENGKQQVNKLVEEITAISKAILVEALENQQASSQKSDLGQLKTITGQQISDLQNIKRDIMENVENIINQMDIAPFKIIINKYTEKLKLFESTLEDIKEQLRGLSSPAIKCKLKDSAFPRKLQRLVQEALLEEKPLPLQSSNAKFQQLLQKVSSNQSTNQVFYNTILKDINSDEKLKTSKQLLRTKFE